MKNNNNGYLSENAGKLSPYVAGIQPRDAGWVKLNTNENPYPPSPRLVEALSGADYAKLKLYPDSGSLPLREAIAENLNISAENVFCGNGSDEVLALAYQAFFAGKDNILTPDISYGFYPVWCDMYAVKPGIIPLNGDYSVDPSRYTGGNGVVLANPNAPTGLALGLGEIELIVKSNPGGVVIIDEAYIDFSDIESAVSLISKYDNLLVIRTFSKSYCVAGLRVGFAVGATGLIEGLERVKNAFNSYPLGLLPQIGAAAAIRDADYWDMTRKKIIATRQSAGAELRRLGFDVPESQANFLFLGAGAGKGKMLYEHLLKNKILARFWDKPRLSDRLRVTVGTDREMEAFIECAKRF